MDQNQQSWLAYFEKVEGAAADGRKLVEWLETCPIPELKMSIRHKVMRSYRSTYIRKSA
jgi:hypothetical protein